MSSSRRLVVVVIASCCIISAPAGMEVLFRRSVILKPEHGPKLVKACYASMPSDITGFWMPRSDQVRELEKLLPAFMVTRLHRSVADDYKQYVGIMAQGKHLIFLSAFTFPADTPVLPREWKRAPIVFCGGGDTVWRVAFDPKEKEFSRFDVNGPL